MPYVVPFFPRDRRAIDTILHKFIISANISYIVWDIPLRPFCQQPVLTYFYIVLSLYYYYINKRSEQYQGRAFIYHIIHK